MKEPARDIKNYRTDLSAALEDTFQRRALDKFAVDYRASRERIYSGLNDRELIAEVAARKDESVRHLDELFVQFKEEAEKRGVQVHLARDAADANRIIAKIAEENGCKMVVKSKSMTVEEIQTNTALEAKGMEVVETDLAEWIIQLRHEGPSHMVMPAIHLSRTQVADTFTKETGKHQTEDITSLVRVARRECAASSPKPTWHFRHELRRGRIRRYRPRDQRRQRPHGHYVAPRACRGGRHRQADPLVRRRDGDPPRVAP